MHAGLLALHQQCDCDRTEGRKYNIYFGVENGTLQNLLIEWLDGYCVLNATINIQTNNSISRHQFLQTEMSGRGGLIPQSVKDPILMHRLMKEPECFNSASSCHQTLICPQGIQF